MSALNMLDVFIGLITIYLVFGIVCTAIVEWFNQFFKVRSSTLETALREMFAGNLNEQQSFVDAFYSHPLIQPLCFKDRKGNLQRPSYIPSKLVGQVVESLLMSNQAVKGVDSMADALPDTPGGNQLKALVTSYVAEAKGDADSFRRSVCEHFDMVMDRASGWFKRKTQVVAFWSAAVLVVAGNVDTLEITTTLANNSAAQAQMISIATQLNMAIPVEQVGIQDSHEKARQAFEFTTLKFGWYGYFSNAESKTVWEYLLAGLAKALGLLISIMAISLGAPFWFDILHKMTKVRPSVAPHEVRKSDAKS